MSPPRCDGAIRRPWVLRGYRPGMAGSASQHWDAVYDRTAGRDVSWFQDRPETSVRLVGPPAGESPSVIDVGGGASTLAAELLDRGWTDVTVLDVSATALALVRARLADRHPSATLIVTDLLSWRPARRYGVWHDRAVFHFLTAPADRVRYRDLVTAALGPGGLLVLGTFAADGPGSCSGLPTARYDADQLTAQLGPGFALVHTEREEHRTPAGSVQPFTWVVLRRT